MTGAPGYCTRLSWQEIVAAYSMFKTGRDTHEIAGRMEVTEAAVYNGIYRFTRERKAA